MNSKQSLLAIAVLSLTFGVGNALAKVSPEQAAKLGNELTPVGAIRAGNSDGSIPEWTGGMTKPPAGYKGEGTTRIDPFSDGIQIYIINVLKGSFHIYGSINDRYPVNNILGSIKIRRI